MGGGADSRIPSILREHFEAASDDMEVVCRTYDFDPEIAHAQIQGWLEELNPSLVIGESLGSLHALRVRDLPLLFVSPALNVPFYFGLLSYLVRVPGVTRYFDNLFRPKEGDRQPLHFVSRTLEKYKAHGREALRTDGLEGRYVQAYFGMHDHYRKSGVVSVRKWKRLFGESFRMYDGTHFMENEYVESMLIPDIYNLLKIKK